ncbi:MAG: ISNCY family transposase [Candidatus Eisenbacteria bacterium]
MSQSPPAQERMMKVREVLMRAVNREITWIQAADILGCTARSLRRWKLRYQAVGINGLVDGRTHGHRSPMRVKPCELEPLLELYRTRYSGFNVRHFCSIARREHGLRWSYSFVRQALQTAGLVRKRRPRGRHFVRRPPRACFGEMLHLDGSHHPWLALRPDERQCLIVVVDDATRRILYAQLSERESTEGVMTALAAVFVRYGLPQSLYTDRASWAACTRGSDGKPRLERPTQVQRALERLGVEHILAYSPQARGRGERVNRTLQGRLVNELRVAGIRTTARANRYLDEVFLPNHNAELTRAPADPASAFVTAGGADLGQILCHEEPRVVGKDNTVVLDGVHLQIAKQPGRATCAGLEVVARRHIDGTHSVWRGPRCWGRFDGKGRSVKGAQAAA